MISAQDHMTFPALQHVLLLLPRPGAVSATAPVYFCDPPSQAAGYPRYRSQTWDAAAEVGCFVCHPRRRPLAHSDGCPHDPGRVPKDLNESARISERRGHIKSISTKYLSEPNLRPETDHPPPTGSEALRRDSDRPMLGFLKRGVGDCP